MGAAGLCWLTREEGLVPHPVPETRQVLSADFLPGAGSGLLRCQAPVSPRHRTWPFGRGRRPRGCCGREAQLGQSSWSLGRWLARLGAAGTASCRAVLGRRLPREKGVLCHHLPATPPPPPLG